MIKPVQNSLKILLCPTESVESKYGALFNLRSIHTEEACQAIRECYAYLGTSELLKHEVMYILGQNIMPSSVDFLINSLNDENEAPVVRHEAGEALSNFVEFREKTIPELQKHWDSPVSVVRSTVRIAIKKLQNFKPDSNNYNKFLKGTIEPAEPFNSSELKAYLKESGKTEADIPGILLDENIEEYTRYQVMYYLREKNDVESARIIARLLSLESFDRTSPLMRHEVCFILGQFSEKAKHNEIKELLRGNILNLEESPIVRHEAILAYSEIWGNDELILAQQKDENDLVNQSAFIVMNEEHSH